MTGFDRSGDEKDARDLAAALWCTRMHGDDADSFQPEFEAWLRSDPRNRQAYNETEEIYILGGADRSSARAAPSPSLPAPLRTGASRLSPLLLGYTILAVMLVVVIIAAKPSLKPWAPPGAQTTKIEGALTVQTASNEQDRTLPDGSHVILAPESKLEVRYDASRRNLILLAGSGRFEVAHEKRPFIVSAGGGRVIATGTIFEVTFTRSHGIEVRLVEGAVDAMIPTHRGSETSLSTHKMKAGDSLSYDAAPAATSALPHPANKNASRAMTIGELVAKANSGSETEQISLADISLASLSVSGQFDIHDTATLADRLSVVFDLKVDRSHPGILILHRR